MSTESVTAILARVAGEHALVTGDEGCGSRKCAAGCQWEHYAAHLAEAQAAALTEAAEGTVTLRVAEGIVGNSAWLRGQANRIENRQPLDALAVADLLLAIADALPKPLPTAPWSSVVIEAIECEEPTTDLWLLHENGLWHTSNDHGTGLITATPQEMDQMDWTLLHDAGAA